MEVDELLIFDGGVVFRSLSFLGDLHEEAGGQGSADVGVVCWILERSRHEFDIIPFHHPLQLCSDVIGGRQRSMRQIMFITPL